MKRTIFTLISALLCLVSYGQDAIKGKVTDTATGEPVPYVSIGIVGTSQGTVSDAQGNYSLKLTEGGSAILFSCLGYGDVELPVTATENADVSLTPFSYEITEVVVLPGARKSKRIGNNQKNKMMILNNSSSEKSFEMGVLMPIKREVVLEKASVNILDCSSEDFIMRLNIYRPEGDGTFTNILTQPIYVDCPRTDSSMTIDIDLTPYFITAESDILVALEYIQDSEEGLISFPISFHGHPTYIRYSVTDQWLITDEHFMGMKVPINITVSYLK